MIRKTYRGFALLGLVAAGSWAAAAEGAAPSALEHNWDFVEKYCNACHNSTDWAGGVAFDTLERDGIAADAEIWEEAVRKLRGSLMPPPGEPQPDTQSRKAFYTAMEQSLDAVAVGHTNPGTVVLHRLNRPEYAN